MQGEIALREHLETVRSFTPMAAWIVYVLSRPIIGGAC